MEQLKSRQGLEDQERFQIEWPETWWEMLRRTHTSLQKRAANTGLAVHRTTIQHTLNNKDLHQKEHNKNKHLKYAKANIEKPFGTMCFGLTKPKLNFLATTKEGMFGEKEWSLCREEHLANCEAWRWIHYALGLCGSWGHRKYCASGRKNGFHQISRNSRG